MRKPRSARLLREEATKLLKANRVKGAPVPVIDIATSMGARIRYSPFEGELAGMLVRDHDQVVIGVNSLYHPNRQRFTVAHECAHLALHEGEVHIDRSFSFNVRVNRRDAVSSMAADAKEIEANRFAAELLMPYNMVLADLKERPIDVENEEAIRELARKYQVSIQAMTHRITNLLDELVNIP